MSKFASIIKAHRDHLIRKLLGMSKNPFLRFNPPEKGNKRIDVCDLCRGANPGLIPFGQDEGKTPGAFFAELMGETRNSEIPDIPDAVCARLRKMEAEAGDLNRATGRHALFMAWPFVRVPWEGRAPLAAPLLFWQININLLAGNKLSVSLLGDGAPDYNFMLESWLKVRQQMSLDFSRLAGEEYGNMPEKIKQIGELAAQWPGCENKLNEENPFQLKKYADCAGGENLAVLPCAAVGIVNFAYSGVLGDLAELSDSADNEEGLLGEFLGGVSMISSRVGTPRENEKYLVETTDASQEHAVWQARKSKVMLLDGPPGTGKSQTIVNLIADALQRGEKVALICQKPTALDVVKKRMEARGLGDLALKITNPMNEVRNIKRNIRAMAQPDSPSSFNEHFGVDFDEIPRLETAADAISASRREKDARENYSVRGHLRGRMKKIEDDTGFYPAHLAHAEFVKTVAKIHPDGDPGELLAEFAADYKKSDYGNNPWRNASVAPEHASSAMQQLHGLKKLAETLDGKNNLPDKKMLPVLFGGVAVKFAHAFFDAEKKQTAKDIARLITDTKRMFGGVKIDNAPPIWEAIYDGKGGGEYGRYLDAGKHLSTISRINARRAENEIIRVFKKYTDEDGIRDMSVWRGVMESVLCHLRERNFPQTAVDDCEDIYRALEKWVTRKRKIDADNIRRKFMRGRQPAAQTLNSAGALRLKRFKNKIPPSLRDICHSHMEEFSSIYPVLMMNPDTMCQILPRETGAIDLAIVDEASQMFVADALPIFRRAKKIIVSGDNMQMPPADTFIVQANDDDGDGEQEVQKSPSSPAECWELLEAMETWLSGDGSRCHLNVHYRSRPAELIAFSNHAFYDGRLQAAPDNDTPPLPLETPIQIIPAAGKFDKGVNEEEINEIVKCLKSIWRENAARDAEDRMSVGVIAFNIKQANRIKDRLKEERDRDADFAGLYQTYKEYEKDGEYAGLFVRSVEHVQGDERDIIILGTTYNNAGSYGKLSDKEKGRKRLNVAVTRAKRGMFVITSLDIGKISNDAERPGIDGDGRERWFLWKFMEYARAVGGINAEACAAILRSINNAYMPLPLGREPDSQFEMDVADFIRRLGYIAEYQIGEGGFRIDLGVKRKGDARYLCGIECDGRFWHSGWRARHNDVWRQEILESKGWEIYRIWSDHWYNPAMSGDTQTKLRDYLQSRADKSDGQNGA